MLEVALGIAASAWAVLMALAPILQVREIVRRRSSVGVSIQYLLVLIIGFALWVAYGAASGDLPLVVPNAVAIVFMAVLILIAWRYR
ncbi:MAG: SemiSWEET family sugar transporter [Gaiellaceae bacterium]